ncbi:spermidine synthase [Streptomyces microflavus]|uniref:spermidine synthase n=1 Tax=Streptomyces microflavus TaxID=1919 RepID=UPI003828E43B
MEFESDQGEIPLTRAVAGGTAKLWDIDRRRIWLLTVDGAPQSYVDLDDPEHLEFEYVRRIGHVLDAAAPPEVPLDVLHLGAGALTLPRYIAVKRVGSRQRVADPDAQLTAFIGEHLPMPGGTAIRVEATDGRTVLEATPRDDLDVLLVDVYSRSRVPAHLTTLSFAREADRALRNNGVYVANLSDAAPFHFLASQLATFSAVFPFLSIIVESGVMAGQRFGNIIMIASQQEQPLPELVRRCSADPIPADVEHGQALERLMGDASLVQDGEAVPSPAPPDGSFNFD